MKSFVVEIPASVCERLEKEFDTVQGVVSRAVDLCEASRIYPLPVLPVPTPPVTGGAFPGGGFSMTGPPRCIFGF